MQSRGLSSEKSILIKTSRFLLNVLLCAWPFLPGVILLLTYATSHLLFSPTLLFLLPMTETSGSQQTKLARGVIAIKF